MRIVLSSGLLILTYYVFEILIIFVLDFYVAPLETRTKEQNDAIVLLHELLHCVTLGMVVFILSPYIFEM